MRERIVALYGEHMLKRSALRIRDGAGTLHRVLYGRGVRTAVEIGTYRGCTTAALATYCNRVVTIDLAHGRLERNNETHDRWMFWESLGIRNVELHLIANEKEKADALEGLDFDFAFIDGAHDALSVRRDFKLVERCGCVLFHDYEPTGKHPEVAQFVDSLPGHIEHMDLFALWTA